jgi:hypothetical protein
MEVKVILEQGENVVYARTTIDDNLIVCAGNDEEEAMNELGEVITEFHPEIDSLQFEIEWETIKEGEYESSTNFWDFCRENPLTIAIISLIIVWGIVSIFESL